MTESTTQQRAFASDVVVSLGSLLSLSVDVVPIKVPNAIERTSLKSLCPDCEAPTALAQKMVCATHGIATKVDKGRLIDKDTLVRLTDEEVEAFKYGGSVEPGTLELHICPASQIESVTRPGESAYRLRLGKKKRSADHYALLAKLVADGTAAFYGTARLNGKCNNTPFRLEVWGDQLVLQSLLRPEDLAQRDEVPAACPDKALSMGRLLVEHLIEDFDAETLVDARITKLADLMATKSGEAPVELVRTPEIPDDLIAALEAALQSAA